jgi:Mg-chelatase subunit ChlD
MPATEKQNSTMSANIQLRASLIRAALPVSTESQLVYAMLEAIPHGSTTTVARRSLNLCLVLDTSSSMRGERIYQVKSAARYVIDTMEPKDHFSLITFNDRAETVIAAQRVSEKGRLKAQIDLIETSGGTEIATGLRMAAQEVERVRSMAGISHIILLTDGRTYGDEDKCITLARKQQEQGVGITALGIGDEWNEDLLESIAAGYNSTTRYITSEQDIPYVFAEELKRMHSIFARDVQLLVESRVAGTLRSIDRVQPFIAPVDTRDERNTHWFARLGDWANTEMQTFLLEIIVPPLKTGDYKLLRTTLRYDLPQATGQQSEATINVSVRPAGAVSPAINPDIKHWLERLTAYRLQARAWKNMETGLISEAAEQLQMAGTRLFEAGEPELARAVQDEATRIFESGETTSEGRKRIKYGTRGLIKGPLR